MSHQINPSLIQKNISIFRHLLFWNILAITFAAGLSTYAQQPAVPGAGSALTPAQCGIPGHHALLERMSEAFILTCPQEQKLEPLLHDEESVSKPLLRFQAFTPDEKREVMLEVKVAARLQIRPLLTPVQQTKMDAEIDAVSKGGGMGGHGKAGSKKTEPPVDPYIAEQSLCDAITNYSALTDTEKEKLVLRVKTASLRPDAPAMTPDQARIVNEEIQKIAPQN